MHEKARIDFNNEVVKRQTREQFVGDNPHIADDAGAEWDRVHAGDAKADEKPAKKTPPAQTDAPA